MEDDLYKKYVIFLQTKVESKILTNSKYKLLLISGNFFHNFKSIYNRSHFLKNKIDKIYLQEKRNERIDNILGNNS